MNFWEVYSCSTSKPHQDELTRSHHFHKSRYILSTRFLNVLDSLKKHCSVGCVSWRNPAHLNITKTKCVHTWVRFELTQTLSFQRWNLTWISFEQRFKFAQECHKNPAKNPGHLDHFTAGRFSLWLISAREWENFSKLTWIFCRSSI